MSLMGDKVNLFWYRPNKGKKSWKSYFKFNQKKCVSQNFGDELSALIVGRMSGSAVCWKGEESQDKLLALGSIMHFAQDNDLVWGTGVNGKSLDLTRSRLYGKKTDIKAVRGPLTFDFLTDMGFDVPEIFGDPGILTAELFPEFQSEKIRPYVVVPHYSEIDWFRGNHPNERNIVSPIGTAEDVIRKITEAELVISSSLHGIIVAESYGIPAILLDVSDEEPLFKYQDYYYSTGRRDFNVATSIDMALELGGAAFLGIDKEPLKKAFPY